MACQTEYIDPRNVAGIFEQMSQLDTADVLTEVSVAALTTDPDLRDIGRSLISLARYHLYKSPAHQQDVLRQS